MEQLTLSQIIDKLTPLDQNLTIRFDFGYFEPFALCSYRGVYSELAICYQGSTHPKEYKVADLLNMLKNAVGKTFHGYKGGEFTMDKDSIVWVSNPSEVTSTAICNILDLGYQVIIETFYNEI